jgi:RNA polymerase sigma-70 factor (ECF subfamily)
MDGQQPHNAPDSQMVIRMLIQRHGDAVVQYCRTRLGEGLAEEVAQDVFVTAWLKLSTQPQPVAEATLIEWVFGIARNKCKQAYRNRARRQAIQQTFAEDIRRCAHAETPPGPAEGELHTAMRTQLHACLGQLRETDRVLLTLWYWKQLPITEIADIMGLSVAAIRKRLMRAQQRLKELMHEKPATRSDARRPRSRP